ncbi:UNVERIFIED_CONTAM: hypothetical protein K2H54_027955 [Gekko kuhli]
MCAMDATDTPHCKMPKPLKTTWRALEGSLRHSMAPVTRGEKARLMCGFFELQQKKGAVVGSHRSPKPLRSCSPARSDAVGSHGVLSEAQARCACMRSRSEPRMLCGNGQVCDQTLASATEQQVDVPVDLIVTGKTGLTIAVLKSRKIRFVRRM